jgi:aryl-alcohol dehydrogenase-like predicted oxidoreductase
MSCRVMQSTVVHVKIPEPYQHAVTPHIMVDRGRRGDQVLHSGVRRIGVLPAPCRVVQVAHAWLLHRSPVMLLIPGTASVAHLEQNVAAAAIRLFGQQYQRLLAAT